MKRRSLTLPLDSAQIGAAVRASVQAFLSTNSVDLPLEFPERIEKLATNLALWGSKVNLTAQPGNPAEIAFHMIDSLMPVVLAVEESSIIHGGFASGRQILDLGSGAGFPGLVLAAASSAQFTLVESRRKRASFLQVAVAEMGLKNVAIESQRAESIDVAEQYDLVTARAFSNPAEFFALASKALKRGGLAMLYANPSQNFPANVARIPYSVARRGAIVERILAVCRQVVEAPRQRN